MPGSSRKVKSGKKSKLQNVFFMIMFLCGAGMGLYSRMQQGNNKPDRYNSAEKDISSVQDSVSKKPENDTALSDIIPTPTFEPTPTEELESSPKPELTKTVTAEPTATKKPKKTPTPTKTAGKTPTPNTSKKPTPTKKPTKAPTKTPTPKQSSYKVGQKVSFGKFEQDNNTKSTEAIQWVVIKVDGDNVLLLSQKILTAKPMLKTEKQKTWEDSDVREWLNIDFYNTAFSAKEKERILALELADGCYVADKVFLLSVEEANELFKDNAARKCGYTAYAKKQGVSQGRGSCSEWWLRTEGQKERMFATVLDYGGVNEKGRDGEFGWIGIRPAIWITK